MGIYDEIEMREGVQPVKSIAEKMYEKQLKAITNISHLDGYTEIKEYWERVRDNALSMLIAVKEEELRNTQIQYSIANEFVQFLNNLESAKETEAKVKT